VNWGEIIPVLITAIIAAIPGTIIALIALGKIPIERKKVQTDGNAVDVETFDRLVSRVEEQSDELVNVRKQITLFDSKNRALWHYVYELIDYIIGKGLTPPVPPVYLESDPKLARIFGKK